jgi:hypothetical protein
VDVAVVHLVRCQGDDLDHGVLEKTMSVDHGAFDAM